MLVDLQLAELNLTETNWSADSVTLLITDSSMNIML